MVNPAMSTGPTRCDHEMGHRGTGVNMLMTRRVVLAAGVSGLLSACSVRNRDPLQRDTPSGATPTATDTAVVTAPATGSAQSSSGPNARVTRGEIESRYAAIAPRAWGLDVPGVVTRLRGAGKALALTFDACGGPGGHGYDAALIGFLRKEQIPATLFINARWIDANPGVFGDLAADPLFDIANHGTAYGVRGTRSCGEVYDEVDGNARKLFGLVGSPARFFRSGTAYYDDVATRIVHDLGEQVIGFEVNGDGGATFTSRQVAEALGTVRPGSIVISQMNHPGHGTAAGMRAALPTLKGAGYRFVHVADYVP
jgi:peptidoglycan/xylan/chitin deacetylase (PgdA/CDA1 family)